MRESVFQAVVPGRRLLVQFSRCKGSRDELLNVESMFLAAHLHIRRCATSAEFRHIVATDSVSVRRLSYPAVNCKSSDWHLMPSTNVGHQQTNAVRQEDARGSSYRTVCDLPCIYCTKRPMTILRLPERAGRTDANLRPRHPLWWSALPSNASPMASLNGCSFTLPAHPASADGRGVVVMASKASCLSS